MRLLFVTREEFPITRVDVDVLFGREMVGRGHKIDLVIQGSSGVAAGRHDWHGCTAFVGPSASGDGIVQFYRHWRAFWHEIKILIRMRADEYDAVQFRDKFLSAAIGAVIANARGIRFFYWLSFPYPEADRIRARSGATRFPLFAHLRGILSGWLLYRWILPRADHTFLQSEKMKEEFVSRGFAISRFTAIPMGIDLRDILALPSGQPERSGEGIVVGYLGALDTDRQLGILIEMLALLRRGGIPARLLLVGDSKDPRGRQQLERQAAELGVLEFVTVTGFLPRLDAMRRIRDADIAISPIYPSPMFRVASPTKLVEYLALGLPVVVNDHPEQRQIVRESRAGICAPWGARHFARSVRWMVRRGVEARRTMGSRGSAWVVEHRTYFHLADTLERKYMEVLGSASHTVSN